MLDSSNCVSFCKMHGLGNDFIIIDSREWEFPIKSEFVREICKRRFGVGCDQLIQILPPVEFGAGRVSVKFWNPNGESAEMCGNAVRCIAAMIVGEGRKGSVVLETEDRVLKCDVAANGRVSVDMGAPELRWDHIPLARETDTRCFFIPQKENFDQNKLGDATAVNMGNPHCIFFVEDIEGFPVDILGSLIEKHVFFPEKINVSFVHIKDNGNIRLRVWERGAGETMACGSAACAAAVASILRGFVKEHVTVWMDGGNLNIQWLGEDSHVFMEGDVQFVYQAVLNQGFLDKAYG